MAETLSNNFEVYLIDLPAFGKSSIGIPLGVEEIADIIHLFCLKLNIINPILLGHSYGGRISIIYASKYDVEKLVLVSSAGIKQKLKLSKKFKVKIYKILKKCHINIKMGSNDYKNADNVKRIMLVKAINLDLGKYLEKIKTPTLLIYGKNDKVTPLKLGYEINKKIANSSLIEMEECGHFPYLERPNIFSLILMSFLVGENNDN